MDLQRDLWVLIDLSVQDSFDLMDLLFSKTCSRSCKAIFRRVCALKTRFIHLIHQIKLRNQLKAPKTTSIRVAEV